jgi:hypothetical protein
MIKSKFKLYVIEWIDSYNNEMGWEFIREITSPRDVICISVGWIIKENKNNIFIAPHISDIKNKNTLGMANGGLTIPKCSIKKRKEIKYSTYFS